MRQGSGRGLKEDGGAGGAPNRESAALYAWGLGVTLQGRAEELAERLAHLPTGEWVDAILEGFAETLETARARFFLIYPWWLQCGDFSMTDDNVETLLELAKTGRYEDFIFFAGSCGVPEDRREQLWEGTRRRLGLV